MMIENLIEKLPNRKARGAGLAGAGFAALLAGRKVAGASLLAKAIADLEAEWHAAHPEFSGGFAERWQRAVQRYAEVHQHPANRLMHALSAPLLGVGSLGLLASKPLRPLWWVGAGSFLSGAALQVGGHLAFERRLPPLPDDPLAVVAGPIHDLRSLGTWWKRARGKDAGQAHAEGGPTVTVEPAAA